MKYDDDDDDRGNIIHPYATDDDDIFELLKGVRGLFTVRDRIVWFLGEVRNKDRERQLQNRVADGYRKYG